MAVNLQRFSYRLKAVGFRLLQPKGLNLWKKGELKQAKPKKINIRKRKGILIIIGNNKNGKKKFYLFNCKKFNAADERGEELLNSGSYLKIFIFYKYYLKFYWQSNFIMLE